MKFGSWLFKLLVACIAISCMAGAAHAGMIAIRPPDGAGALNGLAGWTYAVSWSYGANVENALIDVYNVSNPDPFDMTVALALAVGDPASTPIATGGFSVPSEQTVSDYPWFTGATLAADQTYFLLVSGCFVFDGEPYCGPSYSGSGSWLMGNVAGQTSNVGLDYASFYGGPFQVLTDGQGGQIGGAFQVSGEVDGQVPEPTTWLAVGSGLLIAGWFRRRKQV